MDRPHRRTLTLALLLAVLAVFGIAAGSASASFTSFSSTSASATATFGRTTVGTLQNLSSNRKRVSRFTLAEPGTVSHISAYVDGNGSSSSSYQAIRFVIYADNGGNPAALLGSTASYTIARRAPAAWVTRALPTALPLKAGTYHLGIHSGSSSSVGRYAAVQLSSSLKQNDDSFTDGPRNPFGSASTYSLGMSIYATYTPTADTLAPSVPQGLTMTSATDASISLAWNASTDNVGIAGYRLFLNSSAVGTTTQTSYAFTGLACGTSYTFALEAFDAAGNVSNRGEATTVRSTTACFADTTPPSVPQGLTMSGATESSITLAWNPSSDNNGVAGYRLFRNGSAVGTTTQPTYAFTGLVCGTSYTLALEAFDAAGNVSDRGEATTVRSTTACAADTTPPSLPQGLTMSGATDTSVTLAWNASSDNVGVAGYRLFRNGSAVGTTTQTSYTFSGLACGTSYTFALEAYDAAGNVSDMSATTTVRSTSACPADTTPPSVPQGLTMSGATDSSITLAWNASSDNVGVAGYRLFRNGSAVGTTTQTTYAFTGLACGTSYTLALEAYDASGNVSNRGEATTVRLTTACAADTTPPSVPQSLTMTGATDTSVTLAWNPSSDNVGVAGYGIYQGPVRIATTPSTTFTLSGLACGTSWTLGVDAVDAAGNRSAVSTIIVATSTCPPPPPPPPPPTNNLTANVWVDTNGGTCTRSASMAAYADAAACSSFNAAYQAASCGDTVLVKAGSYTNQSFAKDTSKASCDTNIVFDESPGESVRVNSFSFGTVSNGTRVGARRITVRGFTVPKRSTIVGADHIRLEAIDGGSFYVRATKDFQIVDGDWGPCDSSTNPTNVCSDGGEATLKIESNARPVANGGDGPGNETERGLFAGNKVHDFRIVTPGDHFECMNLWGGVDITVERNRFWNCEIYDISLAAIASGYGGNVLIQNNWFGRAQNQGGGARTSAIAVDTRYGSNDPVTIRYNSFAPGQGLVTESPVNGTLTGMEVLANIFGVSGTGGHCIGGVTYSFNVWTAGACGTSSVAVSPLPYVNTSDGAAGDYHLTGGAAVDLVTPTTGVYALGFDYDGGARPRGAARDSGAHER